MDDLDLILQAVLVGARGNENNDMQDSGSNDDDDNDDSEGEECEEIDGLQERPRIDVDKWRRLGDPQFKKHFRMNKGTFESLLLAVGRRMEAVIIRQGMAIDMALMMTLWVLATPDSFRSVGRQFGVLEGSVHSQYKTIINVLKNMRGDFIQWPSDLEKEVIAGEFEDMYGYPGVIGCIDGCLIRITAPLEQPIRYIDHHRNYSLTVQAVCDNQLLFRDIYVGQPGSVGDLRTFYRSPLSRKMLRLEDLMGEFHLVGDGAYPNIEQLLIPFKDYGNLTQRQRTHNFILSRCRSSIERAFALLKGKWRRLKYFQSYCLEYAIDHITACMVLHNFIILEGQKYEELDPDPPIVWQPGQYAQMLQQSQAQGTVKRNYIATMLFHEE